MTIYYADVLLRRAGLADPTHTRLEHLAALLERYYASPAIQRVSPERASLAFGDSWSTNPDATGGYYLQGELLGNVLDARLRESTGERRGLDDVMRALFQRAQAPADGGFTSGSLESVIDSICACRMDAFFADQIRGAGPSDVTPLVARLGLRFVLDSVPATDSIGQLLPDLRLSTDFAAPAGVLRVVVNNPATAWAMAGLRSADELVALNGAPVRTFAELAATLHGLHIGDRATVDIRRGGQPMRVTVAVTGYNRPRVGFVDAADVSPKQRARRQAWLVGR